MTDSSSDSSSDPPGGPDERDATDALGTPDKSTTPEFTKAPQPELPLAQRRTKAGLNRNRIGIWIVVGGFALYLIVTGIIGILTKAR